MEMKAKLGGTLLSQAPHASISFEDLHIGLELVSQRVFTVTWSSMVNGFHLEE